MQDNEEKYDIDESLGFAVARLHWGLKTIFSRHLNEHLPGLTPERFMVMCKLWERDNVPQSQLATWISKDMGNITRIVDALEKEGYVRRAPDPNDRRKRLVVLTEKGVSAETGSVEKVRQCRSKGFGSLTEAEYAEMFRLVRKLTADVEMKIREDKGCEC